MPPETFNVNQKSLKYTNMNETSDSRAKTSQGPCVKKIRVLGFPGGAVVKNLSANTGGTGSSPGPGRSHMPWGN